MATKPNNHKTSTRPKAAGATKERQVKIERDASPLSIDGIRGGTLNRLVVKVILGILILIFAAGFLFSSFSPPADGPQVGGGGPDPVARVGRDGIDRARFEQIAASQEQMMAMYGMSVGPTDYLAMRQRTLQSLIENTALVQAARDAGITVTSEEVDAEITKRVEEQIKSEQSGGEAAFRRQVEARFGSMENYRNEVRKMAEDERDNIERSLMVQKLEQKIKDENKVTEEDYRKSQTKLKLRQIVIRPQPVPAADEALTEKNRAEARATADKIVASLKKTPTPQNFYGLAKQHSDDFVTKDKGGDLGWKLPSELTVPANVREAVVNSSGKVVGPVVDEASGDHYIFLVENRAVRLPEDFQKNKKKLLEEFETQRDNEVWTNYQQEVARSAESEIEDPALLAYKMQTEQIFTAPAEQQEKLRRDALALYEDGLQYAGPVEAGAIRYQMAQLYRDLKEPQKAVEVLKVASEQATDAPQLDLEYARALRDAGKEKEALAQLQEVSKELDSAPPAPQSMFGGNPNDALRMQIASEFEALNKKELAEQERKKIKPQEDAGGGMPGGMMMPPGGAAPGADPHAGHGHD